MFKCLGCNTFFKEPALKDDKYLCPKCESVKYRPLVAKTISRREVIKKLLSVMQKLNRFDFAVADAFNSTALDDTDFDFAKGELFDLILMIAGDSEISLPFNIDEKIFDLGNSQKVEVTFNELTNNIEGE